MPLMASMALMALMVRLQEWSYDADVFRIFYCTGWEHTVLHYRRSVKGTEPSKVRVLYCCTAMYCCIVLKVRVT